MLRLPKTTARINGIFAIVALASVSIFMAVALSPFVLGSGGAYPSLPFYDALSLFAKILFGPAALGALLLPLSLAYWFALALVLDRVYARAAYALRLMFLALLALAAMLAFATLAAYDFSGIGFALACAAIALLYLFRQAYAIYAASALAGFAAASFFLFQRLFVASMLPALPAALAIAFALAYNALASDEFGLDVVKKRKHGPDAMRAAIPAIAIAALVTAAYFVLPLGSAYPAWLKDKPRFQYAALQNGVPLGDPWGDYVWKVSGADADGIWIVTSVWYKDFPQELAAGGKSWGDARYFVAQRTGAPPWWIDANLREGAAVRILGNAYTVAGQETLGIGGKDVAAWLLQGGSARLWYDKATGILLKFEKSEAGSTRTLLLKELP
jgi:hypothetical protein